MRARLLLVILTAVTAWPAAASVAVRATTPLFQAAAFELLAATPGERGRVTPARFESWFFPGMIAVALAVAVAVLHHLRVRQLTSRHHELAKIVADRTNQLVAKQEELERFNETLRRAVDDKAEEILRTRDMAILTIAKLAELRDDDTGHHMERIAAYSRRLAEALLSPARPELTPEYIDELYRSSPLHDIGKVAIPDDILRKRGPLTEDEAELMRTHCRVGGEALLSVIQDHHDPSFLAMAVRIAFAHHERWDGKGYPRGITAEEIPLCARIVAVADVYDAIRSRRPYKPEGSHSDAAGFIIGERGRHFDPVLVDAFQTVEEDFDRIYLQMRPVLELDEPAPRDSGSSNGDWRAVRGP